VNFLNTSALSADNNNHSQGSKGLRTLCSCIFLGLTHYFDFFGLCLPPLSATLNEHPQNYILLVYINPPPTTIGTREIEPQQLDFDFFGLYLPRVIKRSPPAPHPSRFRYNLRSSAAFTCRVRLRSWWSALSGGALFEGVADVTYAGVYSIFLIVLSFANSLAELLVSLSPKMRRRRLSIRALLIAAHSPHWLNNLSLHLTSPSYW